MARHAVLGNGSLTVGIDEHGLVHDFYYPYVGQENLTNARSSNHKIGVWVDSEFSWIDDSWDTSVDFRDDALVAHSSMTHHQLGIHIQTEDFVDYSTDVFGRKIAVTSLLPGARDIRIFMHQVFEISRNGRADTALFEPNGHYIYDYKGHDCLVISGVDQYGDRFDQFAVGNYGIEGKEGTFRDAEDGELSGSLVEHGGVDSVMRFARNLDEGETYNFDYWISVNSTQVKAENPHNIILKNGLASLLQTSKEHWNEWLSKADPSISKLSAAHQSMLKKSLLVIKSHLDKRGGLIASCDSSIYNYGRDYYTYVWPRDGALSLWPLIRLGYQEEAKAFFKFCEKVLTPEGYLMHKFQPDGSIGSTWHPLVQNHHKELAIQEDETAVVIFMLAEYGRVSGDKVFVGSLYETLVKPAANFMTRFIDEETGLPHASYDLWEEKFLTSTYTTSITYQALLAASEIAESLHKENDSADWLLAVEKIGMNFTALYNEERQSFRKGILLQPDGSLGFDNTIDVSSLFGAWMFADEKNLKPQLLASFESTKKVLYQSSPIGGSPRYEHDRYFESDPPYLGNPWFVTSLWYAQLALKASQEDIAKEIIDWALQHALPSGILAEQVNPNDGRPVGVAPLVWSHAELVNTLLDYAKRL